MAVAAWLYDGANAVRHDVTIAIEGGALRIAFEDGSETEVPREALVHVGSRSDGEVYGRSDLPGWRLGLPAEAGGILPLPKRQSYGGWIDRIGLWPAIGVGILVSAIVLFAGHRFPIWAAPYVPASVEKRFGDALVGDFGGRFCTGRGGQAALDKLTRELSPEGGALNVRVVPIKIVNAAALPGGNIVIFDKLLGEADGPDEVAGILAHEIAHIKRRHVTQALIRQYGFSALIGAFGGTAGSNIDFIDSMQYSRGAEEEADRDAIDALRRANISPIPTARFFERLGRGEKQLGRVGAGLEYVSTHPLSDSRERNFRSSALAGGGYRASLSPEEWKALSGICRPAKKS